jgi:hypothetical protein
MTHLTSTTVEAAPSRREGSGGQQTSFELAAVLRPFRETSTDESARECAIANLNGARGGSTISKSTGDTYSLGLITSTGCGRKSHRLGIR